MEHRMLHRLGDLGVFLDVVVAVHQHLGLHDGHHAHRLADRRIAGQHLGIGLDAQRGGRAVLDLVDLAPLGETGALFLVGLQALGQAIQPLGDEIAGGQRQGDLALVHLDAGHDALVPGRLGNGAAVAGLLAQGLFEQDDARDVLAQPLGGHQQVAPGAAGLLGGLHADGGEALGDGGQALVGGEDAAARLDHVADGGLHRLDVVHGRLLLGWWWHRRMGPEGAKAKPADALR